MRFDIVTLFPEFFPGPLSTGLVGKAISAGRAVVACHDPRRWTTDRHHSVDDSPAGGGGGMVMRPGPVAQAIAEARRQGSGPVLLMSPQGRPLVQQSFQRWAEGGHLILVAGRYEGFDERIRALADEEVSLGDFVLTGGEYAALSIIDGVTRLLPGTLGNEGSAHADSFSAGLLEYPQYTRPQLFAGATIPEVLLSGDHVKIAAWRHQQALLRTRQRRPDLLTKRAFDPLERQVLRDHVPPPLALAVAPKTSDLEALLEWARLGAAYQLDRIWLVGVDASKIEAIPQQVLAPAQKKRKGRKWIELPAVVWDPRAQLVATTWDELRAERLARLGAQAGHAPQVIAPQQVHAWAGASMPCLCLGPGAPVDAWLPSLRVGAPFNDLPLWAAAAALLDRIRGES